ncbi:hypothetical protein SAMN05216302_100429 [Nitrosomonas aestuarii]|uniref:Methyltransferase domain-containing protein n=1 Tax=Nitrosomonas aestuarii TaxID=52441 RepID=A0A1I3YJS8_9PROT|nr:class I SAM-dependent methyltransferase [Nitrosomonas aestuarii]SFK32065.1 hypothetical protein SAMN05216302_100429 [Nitrosomonas aestuarii]
MKKGKFNSRLPVLIAFVAQLAALTMILPLMVTFPSAGILEWAILHGIVAAIFSYLFKMATWWIPIQLSFMPAVIATLSIGLSPYWFGLGFCLLVLIYGKTYQTQVPLYLSSNEVTIALTLFLPPKKEFTFIDLGCGCGGLLSRLNKTHANGAFYGIEAALLPYLIGKIRNLFKKSGCKVQWGDLWKQNLSQYDVVYAYLSPVPMKSIWEKVCREMRPGSIFISNTFMIPGVTPEKSIRLNDFSGSTLYIWRI